jgi:hypothetical protein
MKLHQYTIVSDSVIKMITEAIESNYYPITLNSDQENELGLDEIFSPYLDSTQDGFKDIMDELVMYHQISEGESRLLKVLWDARSELLIGLERDMP